MKTQLAPTIQNLLHAHPSLHALTAKLSSMQALNAAVKSALQPDLAANCQVANLRNGTLILSTSSSVWNYKLRFCKFDLLARLRQDPRWRGIGNIVIKVIPPVHVVDMHATLLAERIPLSAESAAQLTTVASAIDHVRLRQALLKLARHGDED